MSLHLFADDITFLQRFLKCGGLYDGRIDGIWGRRTDAAVSAFEAQCESIADRFGRFDPASERHIRTLQPKGQEAARLFLAAVLHAGITARVVSGTRTYGEQNALFRRGRFGNPLPQVTKARGGQSNHNFGIAWDIGIFESGAYRGASRKYRQAAEAGLRPGLEWGGHWTSFRDEPHYQLATGRQIGMVRNSFESGLPYI